MIDKSNNPLFYTNPFYNLTPEQARELADRLCMFVQLERGRILEAINNRALERQEKVWSQELIGTRIEIDAA